MSKYFDTVFERDNHRCVYCGKDMLSDFEIFMSAEEDHLIPSSKEGKNDPSNIVTSCNVCNRLKGAYYPEGIATDEIAKIIDNVREYIMKKRAQKLKDFMSWAIHEQEQYYT